MKVRLCGHTPSPAPGGTAHAHRSFTHTHTHTRHTHTRHTHPTHTQPPMSVRRSHRLHEKAFRESGKKAFISPGIAASCLHANHLHANYRALSSETLTSKGASVQEVLEAWFACKCAMDAQWMPSEKLDACILFLGIRVRMMQGAPVEEIRGRIDDLSRLMQVPVLEIIGQLDR